MDKMQIQGGFALNGEVKTSGAKNSALILMFATLLVKGKHVFHNVPRLKDIESASALLESLGCKCTHVEQTLTIEVPEKVSTHADYDLVRKMRASILCLGPLVARMGKADVSLPGGCAIGARPINLHLEALKQMSVEITLDQGYVLASCKKLKGAHIVFDFPTVGGTENTMMAAALADGVTTIENAAKEPEVVDLADYLIKMGVPIEGAGTDTIKITGVDNLKAAEHSVVPDRVEAGTLIVAGAITGGELTVNNCNPAHLETFLKKLKESGIKMNIEKNSVTVLPTKGYAGVDISTGPHPGFPTDLQAQYMVLMIHAEGASVIKETVFENRFMHVQELSRLNANITVSTNTATVHGKPNSLVGAPVMATDLRASACLVMAGLVAKGATTVSRIYHLDRGYDGLEKKLSNVGAKIIRLKE
jgi:UDP-N-acetylglucosamine 1-carboxyvinyltransferase